MKQTEGKYNSQKKVEHGLDCKVSINRANASKRVLMVESALGY